MIVRHFTFMPFTIGRAIPMPELAALQRNCIGLPCRI